MVNRPINVQPSDDDRFAVGSEVKSVRIPVSTAAFATTVEK
jgi:hypothetical protein